MIVYLQIEKLVFIVEPYYNIIADSVVKSIEILLRFVVENYCSVQYFDPKKF